MAIVNAKQYCKKTGFPLATLRAYCREGKISHWKRGKVYWLDEESLTDELKRLKNQFVQKQQSSQRCKSPVYRRHSGVFDYQGEIQRLKQEVRKNTHKDDL